MNELYNINKLYHKILVLIYFNFTIITFPNYVFQFYIHNYKIKIKLYIEYFFFLIKLNIYMYYVYYWMSYINDWMKMGYVVAIFTNQ